MNTPSTSVSNAKIDTDESPKSARKPRAKRLSKPKAAAVRTSRRVEESPHERDPFYWDWIRGGMDHFPRSRQNSLDMTRLVRHAYAMGQRDRIEVEKALREGTLVPLHDGDADEPLYPEIEDFLTRLIAAAY